MLFISLSSSSSYHIVVRYRQNRLKVGTNKPKLKVKMQSKLHDDVRKRLLEKPRFELAAKGVFWPGICYSFRQGLPGLRASIRESTATDSWSHDRCFSAFSCTYIDVKWTFPAICDPVVRLTRTRRHRHSADTLMSIRNTLITPRSHALRRNYNCMDGRIYCSGKPSRHIG